MAVSYPSKSESTAAMWFAFSAPRTAFTKSPPSRALQLNVEFARKVGHNGGADHLCSSLESAKWLPAATSHALKRRLTESAERKPKLGFSLLLRAPPSPPLGLRFLPSKGSLERLCLALPKVHVPDTIRWPVSRGAIHGAESLLHSYAGLAAS